jgi:starch phosphorylase
VAPDWPSHSDDPAIWHRVTDIPDSELWSVRQALKRKLMSFIRERARAGWMGGTLTPVQVLAGGTLLDPEALTIGFARRFATYKRATLLFHSLARLKALLHDRWRPVQIVFAGKAHPADEPGRHFIQQVYSYCKDESLGAHIAFVEDYDMHMAKFLVQGVDVWLNTPRAPLEASGTSGQKSPINGGINLSVLDGWWAEGYRGDNGWAIGSEAVAADPAIQDSEDAAALYGLLENEVVPCFYDRDAEGLRRRWIRMMKASIESVVPAFSAHRMVRDYIEGCYVPAATRRG